MRDQEVARELVAVAKLLATVERTRTAKTDLTAIRPLRLKKEGSTRISLDNAQIIKDAGYELEGGHYKYSMSAANFQVVAYFRRRKPDDSVGSHTFEGFSTGYSGEGPRGMKAFGDIFGWNFDDVKIFGQGELFRRHSSRDSGGLLMEG